MAVVPDNEAEVMPQSERRSDVWSDLRAVKRIESTQREITTLQAMVSQLQRRWALSTVVLSVVIVALGAWLIYLSVQLSALRQQRQSQLLPATEAVSLLTSSTELEVNK